ncbi:MAG: vWA domain-containing protein [Nostoc sp. ChiQUE02]|uniref:vWA domain-containing protein n=1 Tax=Nostoc sp. ChiQUE02 TaxID=3075377 RepID=UPI002AD3CB0B|nr:hypothetical protein [Nostoc sp. ChiQUE02]MDZ8233158.1 hypothetical protein [Nostoc sp. ChiQUE02]
MGILKQSVTDSYCHQHKMQINPNQFLPPRRPLPVIVLADVSTSMEGEKITTLNAALVEMHQKFQTVHDTRSQIHTGIITFASNAQQILSLTPVENVKIPTLAAGGTTALRWEPLSILLYNCCRMSNKCQNALIFRLSC